jgi:hypothetical protein
MASEKSSACGGGVLKPSERARHTALTEELRSAVRWVQELPCGYAFRFPDDPALSSRLVEWVVLERRRCPSIEFDILASDRGEPVILRLTGREGVKAFVAGQLAPDRAAR